jgi:hypothetical protein
MFPKGKHIYTRRNKKAAVSAVDSRKTLLPKLCCIADIIPYRAQFNIALLQEIISTLPLTVFLPLTMRFFHFIGEQ